MTAETKAAKPAGSLKAMAEGKVYGIQKATYFKVDPHLVDFEEGFNLREEGPDLDAHLEALYLSMKAGASIPPIDVSVVDGRIIARDGHCRTRAARRLVAEGVEYMLEARQYRGNDADCVIHMLGTAQGKSLTPLEQGRGFLRLTRYGMTVVQISERTGLHRNTVDNWLILAEAPSDVQQMVSRGDVAALVVVEAIRRHGSKAAALLKNKVEKVQATGEKKVTKKHVSGPKMPVKLQHTFISAVGDLKREIGAIQAEIPDDEMVDVSLSGKTLKALLTAHGQCVVSDEDDEL